MSKSVLALSYAVHAVVNVLRHIFPALDGSVVSVTSVSQDSCCQNQNQCQADEEACKKAPFLTIRLLWLLNTQ